jgi:hypothetical protein
VGESLSQMASFKGELEFGPLHKIYQLPMYNAV